MRRRNSSKECLPVIVFFLLQLFKMLVVKLVGDWEIPFVEPLVAGLGSSNQENRDPARIERIENAKRPSASLNTQFTHMLMPRPFDTARVREGQVRSAPLQFANPRIDGDAICLGEGIPPRSE